MADALAAFEALNETPQFLRAGTLRRLAEPEQAAQPGQRGGAVQVSLAQNALRRLCSQRVGLLARLDHGRYRFERSEFEQRVEVGGTVT